MIKDEILSGESKNIEFKVKLPSNSLKYTKTVIAFANGTGGKIIFGVDDKTREITSPGKLPEGQTIERMKTGYSKIRNEALARAFLYMNYIEQWGSGLLRVLRRSQSYKLAEPTFEGGDTDLRVSIRRLKTEESNRNEYQNATKNVDINEGSAQKSTQKSTQKIYDEVKEKPHITISELCVITGTSERSVKKYLRQLKMDGRLRRVGPDKGGHWEVIE